MATIDVEAVTALQQWVQSRVAGVTPPLTVTVVPTRVAPTGISGYLGEHRNLEGVPIGEILGRRVEATLQGPADRSAALVAAFLSQTRAELAQDSVLRITLETPTTPDRVTIAVVYEYIQLPEDTEGGIIETIEVNLATVEEAENAEPE